MKKLTQNIVVSNVMRQICNFVPKLMELQYFLMRHSFSLLGCFFVCLFWGAFLFCFDTRGKKNIVITGFVDSLSYDLFVILVSK